MVSPVESPKNYDLVSSDCETDDEMVKMTSENQIDEGSEEEFVSSFFTKVSSIYTDEERSRKKQRITPTSSEKTETADMLAGDLIQSLLSNEIVDLPKVVTTNILNPIVIDSSIVESKKTNCKRLIDLISEEKKIQNEQNNFSIRFQVIKLKILYQYIEFISSKEKSILYLQFIPDNLTISGESKEKAIINCEKLIFKKGDAISLLTSLSDKKDYEIFTTKTPNKENHFSLLEILINTLNIQFKNFGDELSYKRSIEDVCTPKPPQIGKPLSKAEIYKKIQEAIRSFKSYQSVKVEFHSNLKV